MMKNTYHVLRKVVHLLSLYLLQVTRTPGIKLRRISFKIWWKASPEMCKLWLKQNFDSHRINMCLRSRQFFIKGVLYADSSGHIVKHSRPTFVSQDNIWSISHADWLDKAKLCKLNLNYFTNLLRGIWIIFLFFFS